MNKIAKKSISIREVAELSGVSVATVSRVINDNGRFSEETRQRVLKVIKERGYETNAIAKGLRMNKTNTIGIVVPDLNNSFFSDLVEKIERQFFTADYSTIICDTARDSHKEANYLKMLEGKLVDGIVVISGMSEFDPQQLMRKTPIVCIDRQPAQKDIMFIASNHYDGAMKATEELINQGTRPVMIMNSRETPTSDSRTSGYRDAMKKNGLSVTDDDIIVLTPEQDASIDSRRAALRLILRNIMRDASGPVGIFGYSDSLAAEMLIAAHSMFISVPNDLKIVGFDDAPIARYCVPELTTIHQDTDAIARHAGSYLISAIEGAEPPAAMTKLVDVHLVRRGTV